jgi:hypothetical protein
MIGALVLYEYFSVVLHRVTGVSCALCPDCIGILCLALTGVVLGPDCIGICVLGERVLFLVKTVSVFSLLRRLGCVHQHELRCADAICVGMCSFVWRSTSGCLVAFSRSPKRFSTSEVPPTGELVARWTVPVSVPHDFPQISALFAVHIFFGRL